jgi:two-component system response regulator BaeR
MNSDAKVLIVEDEVKIAQLLADFLAADGFSSLLVHDGADVINAVKLHEPDCILLDVMLPNKDGFSLCKEIREFSNVPIIFLTARIDEIDRLMGLGFGADDYVCKPFSGREVSARVQAILRRVAPKSDGATAIVSHGDIRLNTDKYECSVKGKVIELTPVEFRLLNTLIEKPGIVFSRDQLMGYCYSDERIVSHRTIDSHMKNLRKKLTDHLGEEMPLQAVYGIGYKLV